VGVADGHETADGLDEKQRAGDRLRRLFGAKSFQKKLSSEVPIPLRALEEA